MNCFIEETKPILLIARLAKESTVVVQEAEEIKFKKQTFSALKFFAEITRN